MSCFDRPALYDNAKLHNKIIQQIQGYLQDLVWIEDANIYPLTRIGFSEVSDNEGGSTVVSYPQVFKSATEYEDLRPNDELKAFSFFEFDDSYEYTSIDGEINYSISLIVWYNQKEIDADKDYDMQADLISDVIKILNDKLFITDMEDFTVEQRPTEVFDKYDFTIGDLKYLGFPYGAFKITFTISDIENLACLEALTIVGGDGCKS